MQFTHSSLNSPTRQHDDHGAYMGEWTRQPWGFYILWDADTWFKGNSGK